MITGTKLVIGIVTALLGFAATTSALNAPNDQPASTIASTVYVPFTVPATTTTVNSDSCTVVGTLLALEGLPVAEMETALRVAVRESRCTHDAFNPTDTMEAALDIFKSITFGANPRRTGLPVGYKPKAFWTIANSSLTRKLTCEPRLPFGVTAVGYHGKQQTNPTRKTTRHEQLRALPSAIPRDWDKRNNAQNVYHFGRASKTRARGKQTRPAPLPPKRRIAGFTYRHGTHR